MLPTEAQLVDYFIFDAEDIDVGTFSRAKTRLLPPRVAPTSRRHVVLDKGVFP